MSHWKKEHEPRKACVYLVCLLGLLSCFALHLHAVPLPVPTEVVDRNSEQPNDAYDVTENSTSNDLYIIRAVVYEIGVLTDIDNTTDETTERHEEVNISFYNPPHKDDGLLELANATEPRVTDV